MITKYGIEWPDDTEDATIELGCYRIGGSSELPAWKHMENAILKLWPSPTHEYSHWTRRRVKAWCENSWLTVWGASSTGKAQPLDAIVYTHVGPARMGDLKVGDRVITQEGKTSEVLQVWPRGMLDCYRITFSDGSSTECAGDHLWEVGTDVLNWSRNRVVETEWLVKNYNKGIRKSRYYIPMCEPVYFRERSIGVDPYVLGVLIGDGCFTSLGTVRFSCASEQLLDNARKRLADDYELVPVSENNWKKDYRIVKSNRKHYHENIYVSALKRYGLFGCRSESKFIPEDYLFNSVEIRRDILSGLMDTDGYVAKDGSNIVFSSVSERLAKDVVFLVQSLGGIGRISKKKPWYRGKCGERVDGLLCYNVHIRMPDESGIFRIDAKSSRVKNRKKYLRRYISDISYIGIKEMRCITIDHPRGLYLTDNFICTHNSTDFGVIALTHWLSAPQCTTMTICSTTKDALLKRIWCEILKFYSHLRQPPGRYYPGRTAIIFPQDMTQFNGDYDMENPAIRNSRNGIFGVAVQKGSTEEAYSNLIGVHNVYNAMILDEMQSVRPAAVEAVSNLQGGKEFKFVGMGNPSSRLDLLGKYSRPKSGRWDDCNDQMEEWETERGKCIFFDGRKSPAITEEGGVKRFHFLLKASDIEQRRQWFGENSRKFWSQTIGFIPPDDAESVAFTETFLIYNEMDQPVPAWDGDTVMVAGVDWGFTHGGDRTILKTAKVGRVNGTVVLEFGETYNIPIDISDTEPSSFKVAKRVRDLCKSIGVTPDHLASDVTGTQGPQTDILEQVWSSGVIRIGFGNRASDRIVEQEEKNGRVVQLRARDLYRDRMTELWYQLYKLGRTRQVKGIDEDMAKELVSRRLISETPLIFEPKKDMKIRVGYSPDNADAGVLATEVAVSCFELMPIGLGTETPVGDYMKFAREVNFDEDEAYEVSMEDAYGI